MRRLAPILVSWALILCACAPVVTQEEPAGKTVPEHDAAPPPAEPENPPAESPEPVTPRSPEQPRDPAEAAREVPRPPAPEPASTEAKPDPKPEAAPETAAEAEPAAPSDAAEPAIGISGRITLSGGDADPQEAVVYFVPDDPSGGVNGPGSSEEPREIVTRDKSLSPAVLVVGRGTEVRFPNEDPILHNLFSVSPENDFDLGVYGPGEAPSVTLESPGVVNIYCNVHHDMHAHVLVVDTPWRTRAGEDGSFRLSDLPAGQGELRVWHRQSEPWSRTVELPATETFDVTLAVTRPRLPPHRDKTGQSYNRRDRDPYR